MEEETIRHDFGSFQAFYSESEIRRFINGSKLDQVGFYKFLKEQHRFRGQVRHFTEALALHAFKGITLNTGGVVPLEKITDKKQAAEAFSEGSKELENLLNYVWSIGLETLACCCGHRDEHGHDRSGLSLPYFAFLINDNYEFLAKVMEIMIGKGYAIHYQSGDKNDSLIRSSMSFHDCSFTLEKGTNLFHDLYNAIQEAKTRDYFIRNGLMKMINFMHYSLAPVGFVQVTTYQSGKEMSLHLRFGEDLSWILTECREVLAKNGVELVDSYIDLESDSLMSLESKMETIMREIYNILIRRTSHTKPQCLYKVLTDVEVANLINHGIICSLEPDASNCWNDTLISEKDKVGQFYCQIPMTHFPESQITIDDLSKIGIVGNEQFNFLKIFRQINEKCRSCGYGFAGVSELKQKLSELINKKTNTLNYLKKLKEALKRHAKRSKK